MSSLGYLHFETLTMQNYLTTPSQVKLSELEKELLEINANVEKLRRSHRCGRLRARRCTKSFCVYVSYLPCQCGALFSTAHALSMRMRTLTALESRAFAFL